MSWPWCRLISGTNGTGASEVADRTSRDGVTPPSCFRLPQPVRRRDATAPPPAAADELHDGNGAVRIAVERARAHPSGQTFLAERVLDRIDRIDDQAAALLAPTLIGAAHLLFADRTGDSPESHAVRRMVTAVLANALTKETS